MGIKSNTGFTVIETMLFLSVTGLLAVGILVGSGIAINQQRYRDSVNSLKSYIQQQYSEIGNVTNDRAATWTCDTSAGVTQTPAAGQPRGASDCVVLGRFITIDATGTKLSASNVVGYKADNVPDSTNDIDQLKLYALGISPIDQDTQDVSWGAQVVKQKTTTPQPLSILIVRSPLSGSILTFTTDGVQTNLSSMLTSENMTQTKDLCVNTDIGSFVGKRMEVRIAANAASQSAIEIPSESDSVCD